MDLFSMIKYKNKQEKRLVKRKTIHQFTFLKSLSETKKN